MIYCPFCQTDVWTREEPYWITCLCGRLSCHEDGIWCFLSLGQSFFIETDGSLWVSDPTPGRLGEPVCMYGPDCITRYVALVAEELRAGIVERSLQRVLAHLVLQS